MSDPKKAKLRGDSHPDEIDPTNLPAAIATSTGCASPSRSHPLAAAAASAATNSEKHATAAKSSPVAAAAASNQIDDDEKMWRNINILVGMGFSPRRAAQALLCRGGSLDGALDWLSDHEERHEGCGEEEECGGGEEEEEGGGAGANSATKMTGTAPPPSLPGENLSIGAAAASVVPPPRLLPH